MHPLTNHIIQLQELTLVKDEQKVAGGVAHLQQLNESIASMTAKLPKDLRRIFEKLHKRDHNVIVPVSAGNCSVCGMKLPSSLMQLVRLGETIQYCSNCSRMLYEPASHPKNVSTQRKRSDPHKPGVSRFSAEELMILDLEATDKDSAIAELSAKMEEEGFVDNGDKLTEEALRRETVCSTAVDHGLAFPHVRAVEGGGLTLALGLSKKGIQFNGVKGEKTKIIFLFLIPVAASSFYLKLLAGLTETFMKADAREALLSAETQKKLWKAFLKVTKKAIK